MSSTRSAWLSPEAHEHAVSELDRLLLIHRSTPRRLDDEGPDGLAVHEWRERRIRHLQELLLRGDTAGAPRDDGIAEYASPSTWSSAGDPVGDLDASAPVEHDEHLVTDAVRALRSGHVRR